MYRCSFDRYRFAKQTLNFTNYEDWYKIRDNDIVRLGGRQLLLKYSSMNTPSLSSSPPSSTYSPSLSPAARMVMGVLKDYEWDVSRFARFSPKPTTFEDQRTLLLYPLLVMLCIHYS